MNVKSLGVILPPGRRDPAGECNPKRPREKMEHVPPPPNLWCVRMHFCISIYATFPYYLLLYMQIVLIIYCFICRVSLLYTALYAIGRPSPSSCKHAYAVVTWAATSPNSRCYLHFVCAFLIINCIICNVSISFSAICIVSLLFSVLYTKCPYHPMHSLLPPRGTLSCLHVAT